MKILLIIAFGFLIISFTIMYYTGNQRQKIAQAGQFQTTTIEGCQYFMCPSYYAYYVLSHKGNCTNKIHYCEK